MSKLTELLDELCPDGVEYRPVGEIAELQRGTSITKKKVVAGDVPVVAGGRQPAYFHNEANREGETIVVAGSGAYAGYVSWWDRPIFVSDAFSIKSADSELSNRFCYYWLNSIQELLHQSKSGGGVPHVYAKDVARLKMPVPPLEVQQEIVRVLDAFTDLEQSLVSELALRKKQYLYYRSKLMRTDFPIRPLSELVLGITSGRNKVRTDSGEFPVFGSTGQIARTNTPAHSGEAILIARVGANAGRVNFVSGEYDVSDNTLILRPGPELHSRFIYHLLSSMNLNQFAVGGGQPLITGRKLKSLSVPLPPPAEQERIAAILDKFNALIDESSSGIPTEISLRRQQYEFYRDELLSFTPKED